MRAVALPRWLISFTVVLVAGCGGGDPSESDQGQIAAVLGELRQVQEAGDAELACREVYVIQEPARPGVDPEASADPEAGAEENSAESPAACEAAFRAANARLRSDVHELTTDVGAIEVDGDSATAIVHTSLRRSDGSALAQDVPYDLVRTPGGWRIRIADEG